MSLKIELGKAAHVASPIYMDREFPEEIDDCWCTQREGEPQHKGRKNHRDDLLNKYQDFHSKQLPELLVYLQKKEFSQDPVSQLGQYLNQGRSSPFCCATGLSSYQAYSVYN